MGAQVTLLDSPGYVRNPHLRMKFVQLLKGLLPPSASRGLVESRPDFSGLFNDNTLAKRYLCGALIREWSPPRISPHRHRRPTPF